MIFLGPPGVGKTHLALSLAIAAAQHGRRVYYGTLTDLITSLEEAQAASRLGHRLKTLTHPALLVVDEIGYLPITRNGAMLFFQLMARRYETASTVLTSNKPFDEWGEIFGDDLMAGGADRPPAPPLPLERGDLLLVGAGGRAGRAMEARVQYRPTPQRLRRLSPGP